MASIYFSLPLSLRSRCTDSMMAVIPTLDQVRESVVKVEDTVKVPLFLVRIDGVIYSTGEATICRDSW